MLKCRRFNHFTTKFSIYKLMTKTFAMPQFSFKNKLNLFLKHVHPDILGDCPKELKLENEKSIQELKQYLDHLEKYKKNEAKELEFNIGIDSKKSKSTIIYKKIKLSLDETPSTQEANSIMSYQLNVQTSIDGLISKIRKIKDNKNTMTLEEEENKKEELKNEETEDQTGKKPRVIKSEKMLEDLNNLGMNRAYYYIIERTSQGDSKRKLIKRIDRTLNKNQAFFRNMRKSDNRIKNVVNRLSSYEELGLLSEVSFPPEIVFIDPSLNDKEISLTLKSLKFQNILKKDNDNFNLVNELKKIVGIMCEYKHHLRLYISRNYSYKQMPGFISVPFDFKFDEFQIYFYENKENALNVKKKYLDEVKLEESLKFELSKIGFKQIVYVENKGELDPLTFKNESNLHYKHFRKLLTNKFTHVDFTNSVIYLGSNENNIRSENNGFEIFLKFPIEETEFDMMIQTLIKSKLDFKNL